MAWRATLADNQVGSKFLPPVGAQMARDEGGLIEPPPKQPRPVKGNRRNQIRIGNQVAACPRRPSREGRRHIGAVAVLVSQDHMAAGLIVDHHRTRSLIGRARTVARAAKCVGAGIFFKRQATTRTERRRQKTHLFPARCAKRACGLNNTAAIQALRRQQKIKHVRDRLTNRAARIGAVRVGIYGGAVVCHKKSMTETMTVFNRAAVRRHRDRAAPLLDDHDFLFAEVADRLADRLDDITREFPLSLDLGCRTGGLGGVLGGRGAVKTLIQADLSLAMAGRARGNDRPALVADEETLPFGTATFDAVLSNLSLHWVNDLPGALIQIRHALKPDGLFLASVFGGDTLKELRACLYDAEIAIEGGLSPRFSPLIDVRDMGNLLQRAGFALPVVDAEQITVSYDNPLKLMHDLRNMGEANANKDRRPSFSRRATLLKACELYLEKFAGPDGRIPATFDILTVTAWAPDPSQQKPMQPGSAQSSLAEALGTDEIPGGEKAGSD